MLIRFHASQEISPLEVYEVCKLMRICQKTLWQTTNLGCEMSLRTLCIRRTFLLSWLNMLFALFLYKFPYSIRKRNHDSATLSKVLEAFLSSKAGKSSSGRSAGGAFGASAES